MNAETFIGDTMTQTEGINNILKNSFDSQFLRIEHKQKGGKKMIFPRLRDFKESIAARKAAAPKYYAPKHPKLIIIENDSGRIGIAFDTKMAREAASSTLKAVKDVAEYATNTARGVKTLVLGKRMVIEADMEPGTEMSVSADYDYGKARINANEMKVLEYLTVKGRALLGELAEKNEMSRREAYNAARLLERRKLVEVDGETATYYITDRGIKAFSSHLSLESRLKNEETVTVTNRRDSILEREREGYTAESSAARANAFLRRERREKVAVFNVNEDNA